MDSVRKFVAAAGVSLFVAGGAAQAADMSDLFLEPLLPVEVGSSWYLRGDIGYQVHTTPDASYTRLPFGTLPFVGSDLEGALTVGGGAGYKFNPWFRADVTVDYSAHADLTGRYACVVPACGSPFSSASGRISAWTILANAYFDLGTWAGITPYVGGGIGAANVRLESYRAVNPPLFLLPTTSIGADHNDWNFAWALGAGASIDLTPNVLIDANYRYLSLGDVGTTDQLGGRIDVDSIAAHEFRVGVRFLID